MATTTTTTTTTATTTASAEPETHAGGQMHFDLGMYYLYGRGIASNPEVASLEFQRAVNMNYPGALEQLREAQRRITEWRTRNNALRLQYGHTYSQPWTWSSEVVQVCWCQDAGISGHCQEFKDVDGRTLIREVDEAWMKAHNIPQERADRVLKRYIKPLRVLAQNAGFFTRIYWWI